MSDTTFVPTTTITSDWLNGINDFVYTDIGTANNPALGAGIVGYDSDVAYNSGTAGAKLNSFITPEDTQFGAVGDGTTDDTTAIQAFFTFLAANGGVGILGRKTYKITAQITLTTPTYGFAVYGSGPQSVIALRATSNVSVFGFVAPHDIVLSNFKLDGGYSVTGFGSHGWSFRNADRVTVQNVSVSDYRNSAGLTFVDADDTYGDCHFINCRADGGGTGQNGFLHEGMLRSSLQNCTVVDLDTAGSPCAGLQIKNKSKYCWIDGGFASGCKSGVALGGDGSTYGDGPFNTWVRGVIVKDCLDGAVLGKSTNCVVEVFADQTNSPAPVGTAGYALNVAGFNDRASCTVRIKGVQAGRTSIRVGSDDSSIFVPYADGIGDKLLELTTGVNRCRLVMQDAADTITNIYDLVNDASGQTDNTIVFMRALPNGGLNGESTLYLRTTGHADNWLTFSQSTNVFTFRADGTDSFSILPGQIQPGADNTISCGTAPKRWSEVYAGTGTINTSDAREKENIGPIPDAVLDAWSEVDWQQFRFRSRVRSHTGIVAQNVVDAFGRHGLDPFEYGVLCYDQWPDQYEDKLNDKGEIVRTLVQSAGDAYGIRYDEAAALECALMRRELNKLRSPKV